MEIKDKEAKELIDKANSRELYRDLEAFSEEDAKGETDLQILADELGWILSKFEEDGWEQHEELKEARRLIRETKGGKEFRGLLTSRQLKEAKEDVQEAKDIVNEYARLKRLMNKLTKQGLVSQWY